MIHGAVPPVTAQGETSMSAEQQPAPGNWDGGQYAKLNGLQRWVAERSLAAVALDGDERLLDIGCGDGILTAKLVHRLPHGSALGIDPSPKMIDVALTRIDPSIPNLRFRPGAVETMTFDAEFDTVVSFNALHWVADHPLALRNIRRALEGGGTALLQMVCAGPRESVEQAAMHVAAQPEWQSWFAGFRAPFHHPDPEVFLQDATRAHLRTVESMVDDLEWDFGTPADFLAWCTVGFSDWLTRLPDEAARTEFIAQVGRRYAGVTGSDHLFRFLQLRTRLRAE